MFESARRGTLAGTSDPARRTRGARWKFPDGENGVLDDRDVGRAVLAGSVTGSSDRSDEFAVGVERIDDARLEIDAVQTPGFVRDGRINSANEIVRRAADFVNLREGDVCPPRRRAGFD